MILTPRRMVVIMAKKIPQDVAFRLAQKAKDAEKKITVLCGKLVNGGSGFAAQLWSKSAVDE